MFSLLNDIILSPDSSVQVNMHAWWCVVLCSALRRSYIIRSTNLFPHVILSHSCEPWSTLSLHTLIQSAHQPSPASPPTISSLPTNHLQPPHQPSPASPPTISSLPRSQCNPKSFCIPNYHTHVLVVVNPLILHPITTKFPSPIHQLSNLFLTIILQLITESFNAITILLSVLRSPLTQHVDTTQVDKLMTTVTRRLNDMRWEVRDSTLEFVANLYQDVKGNAM